MTPRQRRIHHKLALMAVLLEELRSPSSTHRTAEAGHLDQGRDLLPIGSDAAAGFSGSDTGHGARSNGTPIEG
ncbi:hypothetical protein [Benzoatithermus flavus]|uniref:Uncharacterized protein n=1 Tax=Benzoatithermus flavus TaxID=3108223 RepID=A0ABU8XQ52_9PROT